MKNLTKKKKKQIELGILIFISIISILLWNSYVVYPIKMFVVLIHEICHGLAAFFTGGKIISVFIETNLGGGCTLEGGIPFVIASSGYLGSLFIGALLFLSGDSDKLSMWVCTGLAALLLIFAANFIEGTAGIVTALVFAILVFSSPRFFNQTVHLYLMKILGLVSCLYVIVDMKEDLLTLQYRLTDAQMLADITGGPAVVWGLIWLAISITVVYFLFKHSYKWE
ncbi:M50 family metallopeptidase [Bacteroidota bacterium]